MTITKVQARRSDHGIIEKTETFFDDRIAGEETRALRQGLLIRILQKIVRLHESEAYRDGECEESFSCPPKAPQKHVFRSRSHVRQEDKLPEASIPKSGCFHHLEAPRLRSPSRLARTRRFERFKGYATRGI